MKRCPLKILYVTCFFTLILITATFSIKVRATSTEETSSKPKEHQLGGSYYKDDGSSGKSAQIITYGTGKSSSGTGSSNKKSTAGAKAATIGGKGDGTTASNIEESQTTATSIAPTETSPDETEATKRQEIESTTVETSESSTEETTTTESGKLSDNMKGKVYEMATTSPEENSKDSNTGESDAGGDSEGIGLVFIVSIILFLVGFVIGLIKFILQTRKGRDE